MRAGACKLNQTRALLHLWGPPQPCSSCSTSAFRSLRPALRGWQSQSTPLLAAGGPNLNQHRYFAAKNLKTGKKAKGGKVKLDLDNCPVELGPTKEKMEGCLAFFIKSLTGLQIGRATPSLIQSIEVQAWGGKQPLSALSAIAVRGANTLVVTLHDQTLQEPVVQALRDAELDLNPQIENNKVVATLPKTTSETREQLIKEAKRKAEECKTKVLGLRGAANKEASKDSSLTKDELAQAKRDIQTLTDLISAQIDEALANKESEIRAA
eukprot:gb/GEZN01010230.1/.p1 GENE.gb/GEZN01010230.1/~~gb/GEZN01010230.1/.p1  ORF type:complete len:267 (+),score=50.92 gb/GEZN01010230.1/:81-881(+)